MGIWGKSKGGNCPFMEKFMVRRAGGELTITISRGTTFLRSISANVGFLSHIYNGGTFCVKCDCVMVLSWLSPSPKWDRTKGWIL